MLPPESREVRSAGAAAAATLTLALASVVFAANFPALSAPSPASSPSVPAQATATAPSPSGESAAASAEPAPTTSPDTGEAQGESAAERLLREAGAGADADLAALRKFEADLNARIDRAQAGSAEATGRITEMTASLRSLGAGGGSADLLYDRIVGEIVDARAGLRGALAALHESSDVPPRPDEPALTGLNDPALSGEISRIEKLRGEARDLRARLHATEAQARWRLVELAWQRVKALQSLRLECFGHLGSLKRSELLGLSREGIAQLGREWRQLDLTARYRFENAVREARGLPSRLTDIYFVGALGWALLKTLVVLLIVVWVRRRVPDAVRRLRESAGRWGIGESRSRRRRALARIIEVVVPWGIFLPGIRAVRWALGSWSLVPEIDLALALVELYAAYRLAIEILRVASVAVAGRYRLRLDDERRKKIAGSVITFLRLAVGIVLITTLAEALVGRGTAYHLVQEFAWLVVILTVLQIVISWRRVIADTYIEKGPPGRLATLVRATRNRWYGVFVAAAALAWLAGRGALTLAREFALGFDQTRKALAFLFRRQVERAAERRGYADRKLEDLPAPLREAFADGAAGSAARIHDHFPGLDRLHEALAAWKERGGRGSFLLTGERGMGKSTWLERIDPGDLPCTRIALEKRSWLARDALRFHWEKIDPGAGAAPASVREATDRLLAGPKRIIVVDAGQNLFLATVGGFAALEAFTSLVDGTCRQVYWVFAINAFTWAHVTAVRPDLKIFRDHLALGAWSEEKIRALIDARMGASGVEATYEDLAGDGLRGLRGRERDERLEQTRGAYVRLLWDYTDGNPRAAIHFWLESLVPDSDKRVRVRAFRTPESEALSAGGDPGLFLLGAVVLHENLSVAELARVTRFPEGVVRTHVERYHDMGVLEVNDRRCRVTSRWHRAVVRRLRRSNLLPLLG